MRVLIFLPCFTYGGAEKQAAILAKYLNDENHDVVVWGFPAFGPDSPLLDDLQKEGIKCYELPKWLKFDWNFSKRNPFLGYFIDRYYRWPKQLRHLWNIIPTESFDVVIPFTPVPCLVSVLFREKIKSRKIIWNHRGGYDDAGFKFPKYLIRKIKDDNPIFVANSSDGARFLVDTFSLSAGAVVIPNAYIPDETLNYLASKRIYKYQVGAPVQLLHVANIFAEKDIWTVLNAMKCLKLSGFSCHLHIAGFFANINDLIKLKAIISENGLDEIVTYHGGVGKEELQTLLLNAEIGLLSSRSEGSPNSVMEYMYTRLPVIGTDIPGIRDVLSIPNKDWLFPYGDAEFLANLIIQLGTDPVNRKKLGDTNNVRILQDFSAENFLSKWIDTLESC